MVLAAVGLCFLNYNGATAFQHAAAWSSIAGVVVGVGGLALLVFGWRLGWRHRAQHRAATTAVVLPLVFLGLMAVTLVVGLISS